MDLESADLTILGRITSASNATLLCDLGETGERAVYKPIRGEVPLWDFPDGTLAGREVASYRVSEALGWGLVPETVLRDGPLGPGMVQRWVVEPEPDAGTGPDLVDLFPLDAVPDDYLTVFTGYVEDADAPDGIAEVALAHADDPQLRRLAVLDVLINNADRKGGHVLVGPDGRVQGVDHGICLHTAPKLRTVLWGWAGRAVGDDLLADVEAFRAAPPDLAGLITDEEQDALAERAAILLELGAMPLPTPNRPIPWPPF
ncbi:SCO1664 family protein [Tsukamurella conjunctivitidis]|uniref:SCO1664 family protein n=2 Tax=Tsukamurella TaxID=2060 RepID=A0A5C5S0Z0_9ACTN|nr:SCO1664 family protein [Tsukamurella columbiensis]TWS28370.1 SCO1664 family protein [Tsukamurella conjunctivitidis]